MTLTLSILGMGVLYFAISMSDLKSKTLVIPNALSCAFPRQSVFICLYQSTIGMRHPNTPSSVIFETSEDRNTKSARVTPSGFLAV